MKVLKTLIISASLIMVISIGFVLLSTEERTERELRTLEGTYVVKRSVNDVDTANYHLSMSYDYDEGLDEAAIDFSFSVSVVYVDGVFIVRDEGGNALDNYSANVGRDGLRFFLKFTQSLDSSKVPNLGVRIESEILFDETLLSFETVQIDRANLVYDNGGQLSTTTTSMTHYRSEGDQEIDADEEETDETVCDEVDTSQYDELYGNVVTVQYSREITMRRPDCTMVEPRRNMPFNEGTYFNTRERGFLELKVNDTKIIRVPPQSEIFLGYQKPVRISRGKAFFKTMMDNVSDVFSDDFEIETPSAVAGIRGTEFVVEVSDAGDTTFYLYEGEISVTTFNGTESVINEPGKITAYNDGTHSEVVALNSDDYEMYEFFDDVLNFPLEEITDETPLEEAPEEEGGALFIIILLFIVIIPLLVIGAVIWFVIKRLRVKKV